MGQLKVALGIPTYRGAHRADNLLKTIFYRTPKVPPITLLDDGSPDWEKTEEVAEKWEIDFLRHKVNMGITASWIDLVEHFDSEYMVLLNDDLLVAKDWLKCLLYFLENNKCGGVGFPFYFITWEDVPKILAGEKIVTRDPVTKRLKPELEKELRENMTPGRVMCATGCAFGFKRSVYEEVGGLDPRYVSFYEESDLGTAFAQAGYPSYGLTYPRIYHLWSQTFKENPELKAGETMLKSRDKYIAKWEGHFEVVNPRFMSKIPKRRITWMGSNGKIYWGWDK